MTEAEWLASAEPRRMLEYIRQTAPGRKLCLLSIACHDLFCPMFGAEADAYEAFCRAAAADDPELAVSKAVEKFPWYWEFDGTAWGFAELMTGPKTDGLWSTVRTLINEVFGNPFRPVSFSPEWRTTTAVLLWHARCTSLTILERCLFLRTPSKTLAATALIVLNHSRSANCSHRRGAMIASITSAAAG